MLTLWGTSDFWTMKCCCSGSKALIQNMVCKKFHTTSTWNYQTELTVWLQNLVELYVWISSVQFWFGINNHFGHLSTRLFNNIESWMHLLVVLIYYAIICKAKTKTTNLSKQCTIKVNGVWTVRYSHRYIQIHEKPFLFCRVYIGSYSL